MQELCEMVGQLREQSEGAPGASNRPTPCPSRAGAPLAGSFPHPPVPDRIYVYAPREAKCARFSGEQRDKGRGIEDWITDVRKALVGQPLTPAEQVTWVCDLLDGEAKREVTFSLDLDNTQVEAVFEVLLEHFGCDQTYVAIQRQFFHRRQGEKESLREFTQALVALLQQLQQKAPRLVPLPDMVLRDTFVENIFNTKLHQELTQVLRTHPDQSFREVRDLALRWERRQAALGVARPRAPPSNPPPPQGTSQQATIETQSTQQVSQELQECREALKRQQQQLDLILQRLSTSAPPPRETPPFDATVPSSTPPTPLSARRDPHLPAMS